MGGGIEGWLEKRGEEGDADKVARGRGGEEGMASWRFCDLHQ